MVPLDVLAAWMAGAYARVRGRDPERGDVPGWVMVTVITVIGLREWYAKPDYPTAPGDSLCYAAIDHRAMRPSPSLISSATLPAFSPLARR